MPRRAAPTEEALAALDQVEKLCAEDTIAERDRLWELAYSGNATYEMIANRCGVSPHTVRLHVARVRGLAWATK